MKQFLTLNPINSGLWLFAGAATILVATIVAAHVGSINFALALIKIGQPVCAAAIGVLMYLAIVERRLDRSVE